MILNQKSIFKICLKKDEAKYKMSQLAGKRNSISLCFKG
jgi:hypothetical protein